MATDGVKIIDGDLARDTYNQLMDLYDSNADIQTIRSELPFVKQDYGPDTDFYHEIFVTAYALALWEMEELTDDVLDEVKKVIALGAGVKVWIAECDDKEGKKRQKELDKLLQKISQPNPKIRKRKKYTLIKHLFFQPDDVLAFQLSDQSYRAVICAKVTQQRGRCTYDLVATTYMGKSKPTLEDLHTCFIAGCEIGSGYDQDTTRQMQPDLDQVWKYAGRNNFFFGLSYRLVTHKDFIGFKNKFEVVGKLKIKESLKKDGSYGYESSFDRFEDIFKDLDSHMKNFGIKKYPVTVLCD